MRYQIFYLFGEHVPVQLPRSQHHSVDTMGDRTDIHRELKVLYEKALECDGWGDVSNVSPVPTPTRSFVAVPLLETTRNSYDVFPPLH